MDDARFQSLLDQNPVKLDVPYTPAPELRVLTTHYNPHKYKSRGRNYDVFVASLLRSGIKFTVVECAFGDDEFELPPAPYVTQVRAQSYLWQKERLLNLAASQCPSDAKYIAWIDCDVLFENPNWAVETVTLLEQEHTIVQLFETCTQLDPDSIAGSPDMQSFGAVVPNDLDALTADVSNKHWYSRHGHTGYGWAARREVFEKIGLYECALNGSADHYMAHAAVSDFGRCLDLAFRKEKDNPNSLRHFTEWGTRFYDVVRGKLGAVSGQVVHLSHGHRNNRLYLPRGFMVQAMEFNPYTDIVAEPGKPLEWSSSANPKLQRYFKDTFFAERKEDD